MIRLKKNRKLILLVCELLAVIIAIGNTIILFLLRNTISYEEVPYWKFEPTPKSSVFAIILHNPMIGYAYIFCIVILLVCRLFDILHCFSCGSVKRLKD